MGEVPAALIPAPPAVADLVKVGDVCGQEIWARKSAVEKAHQIAAAAPDKANWPADALSATIYALRHGMHPTPTYREIAVMLNMSERHVLRVARRGKREQVVEREIRRLDAEGLPMAVENVLEGLQQGDKEYTLEVLKGRGVLNPKGPAHAGAEGTAAPAFAGLVVQFVHDGSATPLKPGAISATPNRALSPAVIDVPSTPGTSRE